MKKEQDVCILAHAYQGQEILEVADYMGDSYGLTQQSKCVSFFCCKVLYWRYRMTVYNSVMELLTGVPVANTTPRPPVISSR